MGITNYADDTTHTPLGSLVTDTSILIKWFRNHYFQLNADKYHFISKHSKVIFINVEEEVIECNSSVNVLGTTIDNKLNFDEHVTKLCEKANPKISNFMSREKVCIVMKGFIELQFVYCPLIWMFTCVSACPYVPVCAGACMRVRVCVWVYSHVPMP